VNAQSIQPPRSLRQLARTQPLPSPAASQAAAYRQLAVVILGLDVATLATTLRPSVRLARAA
jgi:hypothetical protein